MIKSHYGNFWIQPKNHVKENHAMENHVIQGITVHIIIYNHQLSARISSLNSCVKTKAKQEVSSVQNKTFRRVH